MLPTYSIVPKNPHVHAAGTGEARQSLKSMRVFLNTWLQYWYPTTYFNILLYLPTPPQELWRVCTWNQLPENRKLLWHKRLHSSWATNFPRVCTALKAHAQPHWISGCWLQDSVRLKVLSQKETEALMALLKPPAIDRITTLVLCHGLKPASRQAPHSHLLTPTPAGSGKESERQKIENLWVEIKTA